MSSPMMNRMFGLLPAAGAAVGAAEGAAFCACASASEVRAVAATSDDAPRSTLRRSMACASSFPEPVTIALFFASLLIRHSLLL